MKMILISLFHAPNQPSNSGHLIYGAIRKFHIFISLILPHNENL